MQTLFENKTIDQATSYQIRERHADIKRWRAEIDLEKRSAETVRLELVAAGGDPDNDERLRRSATYIKRHEDSIAGAETDIARLEARDRERLEKLPVLVTRIKELGKTLGDDLKRAQRTYDELVKVRDEIFYFQNDRG